MKPNRFAIAFAGLTTPLAAAAPLFAAEGGGAHPELLALPQTALPAMIAAIVMFGALFFLLKKMAWGQILNGLNDRENKIRSEIEAAESARSQANAALSEYQKELAKARADANAMIQQARAEAQRVAGDLRARNEAELAAMKNKATQEIDAAKRAALSEIYAEAAGLSTQIAGKILQREIRPDDHARLVNESLKQLGSLQTTATANGR